jgi:malate dehydrogenase (oxaloacetate-decarboxylating)(NADP+)
VRATQINEPMKLAAVKAIADLAKSPVPDIVNMAYNQTNMSFGPEYIIPKPLDPRLLSSIAPAVAKAAMDSGVAQKQITNWDAYKVELNKRLGLDNQLIRVIGTKAKKDPKRVVFAEADNLKILKAASIVYDDGIAYPILLGDPEKINRIAEQNNIDISDLPIIDPRSDEMEAKREFYGELFFNKRRRKGFNQYESLKIMKDRNHFGCMMVETGDADAMLSGLTKNYAEAIRPALQIIGTDEGVKKIAGMYLLLTKKGPVFLADTTVNFNPTAEELADITMMVAKEVRNFNLVPRIAMLSYSNFGSSDSPEAKLVAEATRILKQRNPSLIVDGEIQTDFALNAEMLKSKFPFSKLANKKVNTLIFPNLDAANITYKMLKELDKVVSIGPIMMGLEKPVHIFQLGASVEEMVNMAAVAVVDAQECGYFCAYAALHREHRDWGRPADADGDQRGRAGQPQRAHLQQEKDRAQGGMLDALQHHRGICRTDPAVPRPRHSRQTHTDTTPRRQRDKEGSRMGCQQLHRQCILLAVRLTCG